ncbi:MAG TPA: formylglycine-generating enzyme family protein [Phycisphaerales bacterium]|nr:formylglycine-generating enzyme family protein [Phycisphaerales bacterium]HMP36885.1 formylglycine-generating enzyme family protein [Phycisphaerales bacterium]
MSVAGVVRPDSIHAVLPAWPTAFGDDLCGWWSDIEVPRRDGEEAVRQRFRWIEPGEFEMGSPEGEAEQRDFEGPRHRVVLTQGFWLADTACTQAMWEVVVGKNPSHFKGPDRPVEQVSWLDVKSFLAKLETLLPGLGAGLPTEAEWEYACRAGTRTPFWFGETITPEEVNYDGNHPYGGAAKGLYRQETVDVKALPANGWGLYQMHGNVWEWCRDGSRSYAEGEAVDPVGPEGSEGSRVLRGGAWHINAWDARSAYRLAIPPGLASRSLGFRLRLRSLGSGPARPSAEQAE